MDAYKKLTANYPRNNTDKFFDILTERKYEGCLDKCLKLITDMQLRDADMWRLFVEQFRTDADIADAGWRGEFWGKMMRGACFVYSYSKDKELYNVLKATVKDMVDSQDALGRVSTYSVEKEFDGWDLWSRKYVLLGMQYFVEICDDEEFNAMVIDCMKNQVDYLISKIGWPNEGKKLITKLTRHWRGLNSSSILEPIVRLYSLTGENKYLDFAGYIVSCGGMDIENVFELAYKNELRPYQYPVTKAYEMTSCFVGLLEYYRINKNPKHLQAVINFANGILEYDFTVIGSAGCTHELFDHSTVRQANPDRGDPRAQETCVTVTLMQFFYQLNLITGDPRYMDAFERSLYNNILSAIGSDFFHFFYQNPLQSDGDLRRWEWHDCPCCPPMLLKIFASLYSFIYSYDEHSVNVNMFIGSSYENDLFSINQCGKKIAVNSKGKKLTLRVRIPEYVENFTMSKEYRVENGYAVVESVWDETEPLILNYDTPIRRIYCNPKVLDNHGKVAVTHGPFVMCAEGIDNGGNTNIEISENPQFALNEDNVVGKSAQGVDFCLIPYYKWCNRGDSETDAKMSVWLKQENMRDLNELAADIKHKLYAVYE